eukprot:10450683-Alexandrium_andersonii.AAC.1
MGPLASMVMCLSLTIPRLCNMSGRNSCRRWNAGSSSGGAVPSRAPSAGTHGNPPGGMEGPGPPSPSHPSMGGIGATGS